MLAFSGKTEHAEMADFMKTGTFDKTTNQNSNTEKETWFTPGSSTCDITQNDIK